MLPGPVLCMIREVQIVLEWGPRSIDKALTVTIDKALTVNIGLLQLIFHASVFT